MNMSIAVRPLVGVVVGLVTVMGCAVDNAGLSGGAAGVAGADAGGSGGAGGRAGAGPGGGPGPTGVAGQGGAGGTAIAGASGSGAGGGAGSGDSAGAGGVTGAAGQGGRGGAGGPGGPGVAGAGGRGGAAAGGRGGIGGSIGGGGGFAGERDGGAGGDIGGDAEAGTDGSGRGGWGGWNWDGGRGGQGGRRPQSCDAQSCPDGCCDGDVCVTAVNNQRCGNNGRECRTCRSCFRCSSEHLCEPIADAAWTVVCQSAMLADSKPNGFSWDSSVGMSQLPDPFCQMTVDGTQTRVSLTVTDSLSPTWNAVVNPTTGATVTSALLMSGTRWRLTIGDQDSPPVGSEPICQTMPELTAADLDRGNVTFSLGSCSEVKLGFMCAQP